VTPDTPVIYRDGTSKRRYTIAEMLKEAKLALREGQEGAWSLIALTAFPELVPLDETWEVTYFEPGRHQAGDREMVDPAPPDDGI